MLVDGQVFASIPAADLDRAKAWYEEKLGLTPTDTNPGGHIYQCADGTGFLLYPSSFAGTGKQTVAGWRVPDLDKDMAELRTRGVSFEEYDMPGLKTVDGIADVGGVRSAWFKDSEDNILAIAEM